MVAWATRVTLGVELSARSTTTAGAFQWGSEGSAAAGAGARAGAGWGGGDGAAGTGGWRVFCASRVRMPWAQDGSGWSASLSGVGWAWAARLWLRVVNTMTPSARAPAEGPGDRWSMARSGLAHPRANGVGAFVDGAF